MKTAGDHNNGEFASEEKSTLYIVAKCLDKTVNIVAFALMVVLLLYAGHSIWYNQSLKNDSFLPEELAQYRPDGNKPSLEDLRKINPDVTAWISIDDTNIDYPVVQGKDDSEYLNKTVLGEFSLAGSIFMSASNKMDFSDPYNMTHGHHVEGGAMFADVLEFRDASFFKTHQEGTLWYPDRNGSPRADRIEIFASVAIDGGNPVIYADPSTVTEETLPGVVQYIQGKATQSRSVEIDENTRIIGLSTCENAVDLKRVLIFGKLRPMSEEEIRRAQAKEKEKMSEKKPGLMGTLDSLPVWLLPSAGLLLIILLIYIIWRKYRQR